MKDRWIHGSNNARAGLMMLAIVLLGSRYYQEVAPTIAMDRVETVDMNGTAATPARYFDHVVKIKDTTPLEPNLIEYKLYAPGAGLINGNGLLLVKYGYLR